VKYGILKAMKIKIEKIIYPGKSLGLSENKTILTNEGLPGETAEVSAAKEKKNYIEAKTVKIINPSPYRAAPRCSHYHSCGAYQYIDYKKQLEIKESQLKEMFPGMAITSTPSPQIWGYRNKIKLSVIWENRRAALAYHAPESRDRFVPIESCFMVSENVNSALSSFLETVNKENLNLIKEVQVRESIAAKGLMLTTYPADKSGKFPARTYIEEKISGKTFRIGPESFFQANVPMIAHILKEMERFITPGKKEIIADLYCGVGTFGISLSGLAKQVIGIESDPGNISFLKNNLKLNQIENFKLYEGSCEKIFPLALINGIDTLILDPPRKGLGNMLCQNIILSSVKKILYLSCNPATLSRDLKILSASYTAKGLHLFDFFPHTPHIETLAILEKKSF